MCVYVSKENKRRQLILKFNNPLWHKNDVGNDIHNVYHIMYSD